jgi:DNA-binding beta-propeller fold protein YncE
MFAKSACRNQPPSVNRLAAALMLTALSLAATPLAAAPTAHVGGDYVYRGDIDLGGPGFWDYANLDADGGRLYVGHVDHVSVVDLATRKVVGSVGPMDNAHGAVAAGPEHKGYATSGGDGVVKVFDLTDFHVLREIKVGLDADGILYDPGEGLVLVMIGDGKQIAMIDPKTDAVVRTVDLPDGPEGAALDGRGALYVNLASTGQLAKVDIAGGKLEAVWPLDGCKDPHGLAYDPRARRLFSGCANKVLVVVDPASGKVIETLPTGAYSDGVGIDVARRRVFCPNGDGTLTVIAEGADGHDVVERTIPTFLGGRSMAVDPASGDLFVTHGDTKIKGGLPNPLALRFGWDNAEVAVFEPND